VVKALVAQQATLHFRQHHGSRFHATRLSFAAADKQERNAVTSRTATAGALSFDV
jgi:hypothetical protein